jgi:hypothetical protein
VITVSSHAQAGNRLGVTARTARQANTGAGPLGATPGIRWEHLVRITYELCEKSRLFLLDASLCRYIDLLDNSVMIDYRDRLNWSSLVDRGPPTSSDMQVRSRVLVPGGRFGGHALQLRRRRIGGGPVDTIVTPSGHHAAWLFADVQGIS